MENREVSANDLEIRIAYVERHVQEPDQEMMRMTMKLESALKRLDEFEARIRSLSDANGESRLNIHEKLPHYYGL